MVNSSAPLNPVMQTWWHRAILLLLIVAGASLGLNAQTGSVCGTPMVVTTLPFNHTGITSDYGDNYGIPDIPPIAPGAVTNGTGSTSYMNGFEAVYAYTPAVDQGISISMTNDAGWAS